MASLSLDLSRINKLHRRRRLVKMLEGPRGLPELHHLHLLSNGRCDLSWLESSRRITFFNLRLLTSFKLQDLFSFYRLAVYRNSRASHSGAGAAQHQYRDVMVKLSLRQFEMLKKWLLTSKIQQHLEGAGLAKYPFNLHFKTAKYPNDYLYYK